ncbi:hypothetical protein R7O05_04200 [Vibrio sp. Vb5032]|uniref:hypothetical protein n=1 Tax=unclassified Vibrio TaxID=2614977 RepID=UPI002928D1B7|nr:MULTISPECIES: hypothetical protein [unclassified Vibrio]MDU9594185.1 hypothetical protein [Vibrio sp. 2-1-2a]MDU9603125.1 hypothetical protein [Vibrio sp. 1-2-3a]MDW1518943.1 hypothetical protein [Vibrio sp. Vb5032]
MENYRESFSLYRQLVSFGNGRQGLLGIVGQPHDTQFYPDQKSGGYYKQLFIDQVGILDNKKLRNPPNDATCQNCKGHFLGNRPKIDHQNDLKIGTYLEQHFMQFMNEQFNLRSWPFVCERADTERLNMPDFKITDTETGSIVLYFEFKCIFKPFIMVGRKIDNTHCYSHSMTLDGDDKLNKQKQLVYHNGIKDKTVYIYWYDIPCVKGVFWQFCDYVFDYRARAETYSRVRQDGDYRSGRQVGHVDKIYLPLHQMKHFQELLFYLEKNLCVSHR